MGKAKRVAIYLRVSTTGQTVENQKRELEEAGERHGWEINSPFQGCRVLRRQRQRPAPRPRCPSTGRSPQGVDLVAAWSVDRLGRSLQDLLGTLGELHAKGVGLYLHQQGLDTSTPAGKAMFQMMGVFAEFERAMIRERVMAGLKRAKANGTTLGRPRIDEALKAAARKALRSGKGIIKVAKELSLGVGTVHRIKREMTGVA